MSRIHQIKQEPKLTERDPPPVRIESRQNALLLVGILLAICFIALLSVMRHSKAGAATQVEQAKVQGTPIPIDGMPGCSLYHIDHGTQIGNGDCSQSATCWTITVVRCHGDATATRTSGKYPRQAALIDDDAYARGVETGKKFATEIQEAR